MARRRSEVLERLRAADGDWVDGAELWGDFAAGAGGLTRLRELRREEGWPIEHRIDPERRVHQYRLAGERERDPHAAEGQEAFGW